MGECLPGEIETGHTIGQHYGISPCPSVSVCEVQALDIIVVGSDGLWNALGMNSSVGRNATHSCLRRVLLSCHTTSGVLCRCHLLATTVLHAFEAPA